MNGLLQKLAAEVEKYDPKMFKLKGDKPGAGGEEPANGKEKESSDPVKADKGNTDGSSYSKENKEVREATEAIDGKSGQGSQDTENGEDENDKAAKPAPENEVPSNQSAIVLSEVISFLAQNPNVTDEEFHAFAETKGYDVHQAEAVAYSLAAKYAMLLRGGRSGTGDVDISTIDQDQLEKGMQVETEHSDDPITTKKIALDHLVEIPDYYDRLEKMELEAKGSQQ